MKKEKNILGLDLGTNSIGWAVVQAVQDEEGKRHIEGILDAGSRIIPMDKSTLGDFNKGESISQTAQRTRLRGIRRNIERSHLRRERLNRTLHTLGWLPEHYDKQLDGFGKFLPGTEPKIAWKKNGESKYEFLFHNSFMEMVSDFKNSEIGTVHVGMAIPYDWTIYYLRKKALTQKVTKEELAWIILSFNQKRGYYQLRDEEKESQGKQSEYYSLKIVDIRETGEVKGKDRWYELILENGFVYKRTFRSRPDWIGETKDFIVTTDVDGNGNPKKDKEGNIKRKLRTPEEDDWTLLKKKTEREIEQSQKTVGEYIYDTLLANPDRKIRGEFVKTVERKYYKSELLRILEVQSEFYPEFSDRNLLAQCVEILYPSNVDRQKYLKTKNLTSLIVDEIIFYQRPLKSKKSLVDDCPFEKRIYKDQKGELKEAPVKCIAKSHPLFQEFRLWQFLSNLRIYRVNEKGIETDITGQILMDHESYAALFKWLNDKKDISQKGLFSHLRLKPNEKGGDEYRWNYVPDKIYPCNETRAEMLKRLKNAEVESGFLTHDVEERLWHILYSIDSKDEIVKALRKFAEKYGLADVFTEEFSKFPPFKKEYGAYSAKAIKKLLQLMRRGNYWSEESIDKATLDRIGKILSGEYDTSIGDRVREKAIALHEVKDFQGLPVWLASYVIFDRHSESANVDVWRSPEDVDSYLKSFKQHSLRNPIVEAVVMETLRTVRDIWKEYNHIDEIHVELGREMKNPASKRKQIAETANKNENDNLRAKAMLIEFMNDEFGVENVRPYSPSQQEIFKIYENTVIESEKDIPDDIQGIIKKFNESDATKRPTSREVLKYKLWLDQKYISPYTGQPIPLSKLFTHEYEIEHVIPQSVYFDNSFNNKVICEAEVNGLKGNMLGYAFIKSHHDEIVQIGTRTVKILSVEAYEDLVKKTYKSNLQKRKNLLAEDIPEDFIKRQLNDTRYISKYITAILSNIVREEDEKDGISKHVVVCTGGITDRLKKDWGINDVWNKIIMPRFLRMNEIHNTNAFTKQNTNGKNIPDVPINCQKGFSKKRIDHRHHAMDAIVIACADRNIVNLLNNQAACKDSKISRYDLQRLVCEKRRTGDSSEWVVKIPYEEFQLQVYDVLQNITVSFKQNLRVLNKTSNKAYRFVDGKKRQVPQEGENLCVRKSLHRDTYFGEVNLRKVKKVQLADALKQSEMIVDRNLKERISELEEQGLTFEMIKKKLSKDSDIQSWVKVYYYTGETNDRYFAVRKKLSKDIIPAKKSGESDEDYLSRLEDSLKLRETLTITDTGIKKILINHLKANNCDVNVAFSPEGIDQMNRNIVELNGGKQHYPIYSVRVYEQANKFPVGVVGNKSKKFVEADQGTNLYFGVYKSGERRSYSTIPLIDVVQRLKEGLSPVPETNENGESLLFYLSPGDLVYVPTPDELESRHLDSLLHKERIYKMVSSSKTQCFFIQESVASPIVNKEEFASDNKMERAITGEMIKDICIPIKVDRLGHIVEVGYVLL